LAVARLLRLVDRGTFRDLERSETKARGVRSSWSDGAIAGRAKVGGRKVVVFSQDEGYKGGSMGVEHTRALSKAVGEAAESKLPLLGIYSSGGARVQEGTASLAEAAELLNRMVRVKGRIPQISAVVGNVSGGAAYAAAMADVIVIVKGRGRMFVWGPSVVAAETRRKVTLEGLGGSDVHIRNGLASLVVGEDDWAERIRLLLSFLGPSEARPPASKPKDKPERNARRLIDSVFDGGSFLELHKNYGMSAVCGLARLKGRPVGVVATNFGVGQGFLDVEASRKIAKTVSLCNCWKLGTVTFLDSRGYLPSPSQETKGLIEVSREMISEYSKGRQPKVTVVTGEAYGGVFVAMAGKAGPLRRVLAYPGSRIAVLSLQSYLEVFHRRRLDRMPGELRKAEFNRLSLDYLATMDPKVWERKHYITRVIQPRETREELIEALS